MGWTTTGLKARDHKAAVIALFDNTDPNYPAKKVLHISQRGNIFYLAVQITPIDPATYDYGIYEPHADGSFVIGVVVQTINNHRDGFGYKMIEEGSGPCEEAAPVSLIQKLSPIDLYPADDTPGARALDWRSRCTKAVKNKPPSTAYNEGDIIEFATNDRPSFRDPKIGKSGRFKIVRDKLFRRRARILFQCCDTHTVCRITGAFKRQHVIHPAIVYA